MAELYGKATGCAKGKGGSMHFFGKGKFLWRSWYSWRPDWNRGGLALLKNTAIRTTLCFAFGDGAATGNPA
jgi:pyruvate dehydrogenase E1 component alpha subunit